VDLPSFLVIGPLILISLTIYLQIFVGHWRATSAVSARRRLPFLFNLEGPLPCVLSGVVFYWLSPLVLCAFALKAVRHTEGSALPLVTVATVVVLIFLQLRRWPGPKRWALGYRALWLLFAVLVLFLSLSVTNAAGQADYRQAREGVAAFAADGTVALGRMAGVDGLFFTPAVRIALSANMSESVPCKASQRSR
jgi:hypothetical protein